MNTKPYPSALLLLLLLLPLVVYVYGIDVGDLENVAFGKPVHANTKNPQRLVDGKRSRAIQSRSDSFPMYFIDLEDIYELKAVRLYGPGGANAMLNTSFSVFAWNDYTAPCELGLLYPWKPIQTNLTFTTRGEVIEIPGPFETRYLIIMTDTKDFIHTAWAISLNEVEAYGTKLRDGYRPPTPPDDEMVVNEYFELRQTLLSGQSRLFSEPSYGVFKPRVASKDVPLGWRHTSINTMAVTRGKGRVILMSGTRGLDYLLNSRDYTALRKNFQSWLSHEDSNAKFVSVSDPSRGPNDIIYIKNEDDFDENEVAQEITQLGRGAIIAYSWSATLGDDAAIRLMQKLDVGFEVNSVKERTTDMKVKDLISRERNVPLVYQLRLCLESWTYFKSVEVFRDVNTDELYDPQVQMLVKELLEKYYEFFAQYGACDRNPYKHNPEINTAFFNYNYLLLLQRSEHGIRAPGSFRSPGIIDPSRQATSYNVTFNIDVRGNFFPMGGYAKPGEAFHYKVIQNSAPDLNGFAIRINMQTDKTFKNNPTRRWPVVTVSEPLKSEGMFMSAFGGPIVLQIPSNTNVTIEFRNVYRYPFFNIRDPKSLEQWDMERHNYAGVPFLVVMGDNMIGMLETPTVIEMSAEDIYWSTKHYDDVIKVIHNYRGTDHLTAKMQAMATDDQISIGWGHSGYPWKGFRKWVFCFANLERIKSGDCLGYVHEIGHNLQVGRITLTKGTEVTNNIYVSVTNQLLLNLKSFEPGAHPGLTERNQEQELEKWRGGQYVGVGLTYYNLLSHHFGMGLVGNVMTLATRSELDLKTEEDKISFWVKNLCNESGYDLVPFHRLWHFPLDEETINFCGSFRCWFPDDFMTQREPGMVKDILHAYGKKCCSSKPRQVKPRENFLKGVGEMKPQSIFLH